MVGARAKVGTPRCGVTARVPAGGMEIRTPSTQNHESMSLHRPGCAAERGADGAARHPYQKGKDYGLLKFVSASARAPATPDQLARLGNPRVPGYFEGSTCRAATSRAAVLPDGHQAARSGKDQRARTVKRFTQPPADTRASCRSATTATMKYARTEQHAGEFQAESIFELLIETTCWLRINRGEEEVSFHLTRCHYGLAGAGP